MDEIRFGTSFVSAPSLWVGSGSDFSSSARRRARSLSDGGRVCTVLVTVLGGSFFLGDDAAAAAAAWLLAAGGVTSTEMPTQRCVTTKFVARRRMKAGMMDISTIGAFLSTAALMSFVFDCSLSGESNAVIVPTCCVGGCYVLPGGATNSLLSLWNPPYSGSPSCLFFHFRSTSVVGHHLQRPVPYIFYTPHYKRKRKNHGAPIRLLHHNLLPRRPSPPSRIRH